MRALALWVSVLLTLAAAVVAAVLILPPPTTFASHLAIFFDEKLLILVGGVLVAALFARLAGRRRWIVAQALVGLGAVVAAAIPPLQSLRVGVDVDPARVTLLGRSAGGHLSMLGAYAPDDPALPASCDAGDTHVASVISFYGPTDLAWGWEHPSNPRVYDGRRRIAAYVGDSPSQQPERHRLLSPLTHVTASSPPTLLIQGAADSYVSPVNAELMSAKLAAAGVRHEVLVVPHAQRGFDFIFGGLGEQLAEHAILRFLRVGA